MADNTSLLSLIQAGLVWSTTLAWSDVVRTGTSYVYPNDKEKALEAQFIYAIIITLIVIVIFYFLQKAKHEFNKISSDIDKKIKDLQNQITKNSQNIQTSTAMQFI